MRLNEIVYNDARPIDGYGPGFFRVAGKVIEGPVLVSAQGAVPWGGLEDIQPLLAMKDAVDVLFIGTGAEVAFLPRALREQLEEAGLSAEAMATPSAARTYNVLLSEGRRVAVALLPVLAPAGQE